MLSLGGYLNITRVSLSGLCVATIHVGNQCLIKAKPCGQFPSSLFKFPAIVKIASKPSRSSQIGRNKIKPSYTHTIVVLNSSPFSGDYSGNEARGGVKYPVSRQQRHKVPVIASVRK